MKGLGRRQIGGREVRRFQGVIYDHYRRHGRRLPWRKTRNPYRILVSEVMLQQTQAERVVPKYGQFIEAFPTFESLARARSSTVLKVWQGLGYNRRAIALKKTAERVVSEFKGTLPKDPETLKGFPGIGPATAASIAAFAFNKPALVLETNVRTVFIQYFFPHKGKVSDEEILALLERTLDRKNPRKWYNALMDYGAMLKRLHDNPSRRSLQYRKQGPFEGSNRQVRGAVIKVLTQRRCASISQLAAVLDLSEEKIGGAVAQLQGEGLVHTKRGVVHLG